MNAGELKFAVVLFGLAQAFKVTARLKPEFAARLRERDLVAQIVARDEGTGRWFRLRGGRLTSRRGIQRQPDITLAKEMLGWEPKVHVDEGLKQTIAYFRKKLDA